MGFFMCPRCRGVKKVSLKAPYDFLSVVCPECSEKPQLKTRKKSMENGLGYYYTEIEHDRQVNWLWEQRNKRPEDGRDS